MALPLLAQLLRERDESRQLTKSTRLRSLAQEKAILRTSIGATTPTETETSSIFPVKTAYRRQVETLTKERDDARKELALAQRCKENLETSLTQLCRDQSTRERDGTYQAPAISALTSHVQRLATNVQHLNTNIATRFTDTNNEIQYLCSSHNVIMHYTNRSPSISWPSRLLPLIYPHNGASPNTPEQCTP